jgi:hypothetical protein
MPRAQSSPNLDALGEPTDPCMLGNDCPYAGAMRFLHNERLKRELVEVELERLADKFQKTWLSVEAFERKILDVTFRLEAHTKQHRWFEIIILGVAMGVGSAIQRWLGGK